MLEIIGSVNGHSIVLNSAKLFSIYARIRESPGDIVVKDIKETSPLRPRLLKLKVSNRNLLRIEKTYLNATAALNTHACNKTYCVRSNTFSPYN